MDDSIYYRSVTGAAELELVAGSKLIENCACLHIFHLEDRAKDWNGLVLDAQTARRLADDLNAWLTSLDASD